VTNLTSGTFPNCISVYCAICCGINLILYKLPIMSDGVVVIFLCILRLGNAHFVNHASVPNHSNALAIMIFPQLT
jgi:hypothetical protein